MVEQPDVRALLDGLNRHAWAVVYAYNPPSQPRSLWYDRWRYDVINDYVEAVSSLKVEPFIVDVDAFLTSDRLRRAEFTFAINLNSGATPISNLGLVPCVAQWHGIPCFPNTADVILSGERKDICKRFFAGWFMTPKDLDASNLHSQTYVISKPKTMGNSQRVVKRAPSEVDNSSFNDRDTIVEEFIDGYEVTVPVFFDALQDDYVVLPPIVYIPDVSRPTEWYLSYDEKMSRKIKIERVLGELSPEAIASLRAASRAFGFSTLARFDFRWRAVTPRSSRIELDSLWFLEINCLPTLRTDVNFILSLCSYLSSRSDPFTEYIGKDVSPDIAALGYLLLQSYVIQTRTK